MPTKSNQPADTAETKPVETTAPPEPVAETPKTPDTTADQPTPEEVAEQDKQKTEPHQEVPADDPNKPTAILDETAAETADRHVASTELPVGDLTDPATQADTQAADDAKELIVPGAATGPDPAGVVLNDHGKVAYAPPGTHNAAMAGVQQDASGHVSSVGTDNTPNSGTRA